MRQSVRFGIDTTIVPSLVQRIGVIQPLADGAPGIGLGSLKSRVKAGTGTGAGAPEFASRLGAAVCPNAGRTDKASTQPGRILIEYSPSAKMTALVLLRFGSPQHIRLGALEEIPGD